MADQTTAAKHDINALNGLYLDGESCDQEVFAEQRSNLLLVAGEHYNRRQSLFYKRLRDTRELNQEQRLRLTKNHIQNICKLFANNIISATPGVGFEPKDEKSVQDQKAADLHHAVWQDADEKYGIQSNLIDQWCDSFIQVGEVITKIFWDPFAGEVKAFEQKVGEDGQPVFIDRMTGEETSEALDDQGFPHELQADENLPVFAGAFVFEEVYGFNCLRSAQAKRMEDSPHLCVRKMAQTKDMLSRYKDDPDKAKCFVSSGDDTFVVFDGGKGGYKKTEGLCMIREYYFRPGPEYPRGYFFFTTKEGIFEEGELPGGIFPIVSQSYETIQTTCRGRSPIKHMRPYQIEINRAASKIAEHQVTLGDDKLLSQNGTKISAGIALPGIRAINYTGMEPKILEGRAGDQYVAYMEGQIQELYQVMSVSIDSQKETAQMDPFALLFRSASQKKVFQRYTKRFENFLMNVAKTYLRLAKIHLPDDQIIWAVGKSEQINIPEYKNSNDICYQIIVEAQSDDIETKLGKQMAINHVMQYVGPQLKPEDIGKMMRQMPYANFDGSFDDMTIDFDTVENTILALDRGEQVQPSPFDDNVYTIKRLTLRMRKPDFRFLPPQVQQNYQQIVQMHQQQEAQRQQQLQMAEQGYIPTGGQLLGCDFFVADPESPSKTRRARLPAEAIQWLVQHLESQGQSLDQLEGLNPGSQGQIATMMNRSPMGGMMSQPQGPHSSVMPPPGMGHAPPQALPPPQGGGNGNPPFRSP